MEFDGSFRPHRISIQLIELFLHSEGMEPQFPCCVTNDSTLRAGFRSQTGTGRPTGRHSLGRCRGVGL